jgi:hypothetical protein
VVQPESSGRGDEFVTVSRVLESRDVPLPDARRDGQRRLLRHGRTYAAAPLGFVLRDLQTYSLCRADRLVARLGECHPQDLGQALGVLLGG